MRRKRVALLLPILAALLVFAVSIPMAAQAADPLVVTTASLADGEVNAAYSAPLAATGGTTPYTWSVASGSLPAGLSIVAGVITGTPTTAGTTSFTVQVTDAASETDTQILSITVAPAVTITTTTLPAGTAGAAYSQTLAATGGVTPYSWSIVSGSLPTGLSLVAGAITGTPTAAGTTTFTAKVTDAASGTDTQVLSITVNATVTVTTIALPNGTAGTAYSQALAATGGVTPYSWSIVSGSLPAGLSLAAGAITGTPTAAGASTFTVQVTDAATATDLQVLSITVIGTVNITTMTLPNGTVGAAYAQTIAATGGVTPYSWSLAGGTLPAGLTLATSTGVISGTATTSGTSTFTMQVTDAASATDLQVLSITIDAAGVLSITTLELPKGAVGTVYSTTLVATGGVAPLTWSVIAGSLPNGLSLDSATGVISGTPTVKGKALFVALVKDGTGAIAGKIYVLNVKKAPKPPAPTLDEKVLAACEDAGSPSPALSALCRIYSNEQVGSPALSVIGKVILKIAHREADQQDKQDRKEDKREAKEDKREEKREAKEDKREAKAHKHDKHDKHDKH